MEFNSRYIIVTAAKNEEKFIELPLNAVINQTILPEKWIIVSDGSTDNTDKIIEEYSLKYDFIELLKVLPLANRRNFQSQSAAINLGISKVKNMDYDFIGNIDADVSFEPDYFEKILMKFYENEKLGLAGGTIQERQGNVFKDRKTNNTRSVPNAIQLFRRECYEDINGYKILKYGGHDVLAEYESRMHGWEVKSFPEIKVHHHRITNTGNGSTLNQFIRIGKMDYSLGSHPLFELLKCLSRITVKPFFVASLLRFSSYLWSALIREERSISKDVITFTKKDQLKRLNFLKVFK